MSASVPFGLVPLSDAKRAERAEQHAALRVKLPEMLKFRPTFIEWSEALDPNSWTRSDGPS